MVNEMNNINKKRNKLYQKFTETGKISDYLLYAKEKNNDVRGRSNGTHRGNSSKYS